MDIQPLVRELLRFEAQRLGIPIHLGDEQRGEPDALVVMPPPSDAPTEVRAVVLGDGIPREVHLARLDDGEVVTVPGPFGPVAVAATTSAALLLAFDPNLLASSEHRRTLAHIWDAAVVPALDRLSRSIRDRVVQAERDAFVQAEERVWRESASRLPAEIDNTEYGISRVEGQLRDQVAKLNDLRRQQRALQIALPEAVRQAAGEQHEALRRLVPRLYRSVHLRDSAIVGVIGPIVLEDDEAEVEVGTFQVSIGLDTAQVEIRNITNVVNGIHHPHVRGGRGDDICWGNVRPGVTRLLAEHEWAGLLSVIAQFLGSYARNDAYQKLAAWDPDRSEGDDDEYDSDDEDSEDDTVECSICLEQTASDEITHVQDEPVCLACYERDTAPCGECSTRTLSRNIARESMRCRTCVPAVADAAQVAS